MLDNKQQERRRKNRRQEREARRQRIILKIQEANQKRMETHPDRMIRVKKKIQMRMPVLEEAPQVLFPIPVKHPELSARHIVILEFHISGEELPVQESIVQDLR